MYNTNVFWSFYSDKSHFFLFSLYYIEYFSNILDWHLQKYISLVYFRVTPTFADDIKIYTSQLKSSYTIAYNFWYDLQRIEIFTRKILIVQSRGYDYDLQLQNSWLLLSCPFFLASGLSFMDFRVNEPDQRCIKGSRFAALHIVLQMWFMFVKSIFII